LIAGLLGLEHEGALYLFSAASISIVSSGSAPPRVFFLRKKKKKKEKKEKVPGFYYSHTRPNLTICILCSIADYLHIIIISYI
jgi:hypothetical protein